MNITIKEKGTAENFSGVLHIEVPSKDAGSVEWIPEEGHATGIKHITENGIYRASDDGFVGYTGVVVTVQPTQVTGVNPADGQRYTVKRDEFGNLLYLPAE
jgi:hypothetical protein